RHLPGASGRRADRAALHGGALPALSGRSALVRAVPAASQVALERLRDGVARGIGGVPGVAGALQLADILGHVLVLRSDRVDRRYPCRLLVALVLARVTDPRV